MTRFSFPSLSKALGLLGLLASVASCQDLDPAQVGMMGNNSLFTYWRPTSRFIAPHGWMNDPCGAMYDPIRGEYHLFYQWHPNHVNWGNISWGHAISRDMITWTDVTGWRDTEALALGPGPVGSYDGLGVFSGTAQPVNLQGEQDGTLTIFYTSVSKLPTSWSITYQNGTESQSIALSSDGGRTWERYEGNPIITTPPEGWNITGWRDPFVEPWPEMDTLLGQTEPHYYSVYGSGIKGVGPRIPFYSAPASDLTNWTFLGALWEPEANASVANPIATGSYGFNFEVSGFFSLTDDDGEVHYFTQMGSEGGNGSFHTSPQRALWAEGVMSKRLNGSAQFTPISGGLADWGNLYAVTSFVDTKNHRRVQWGWCREDMNGYAILQQGFQGAFPLPRELFVHKAKHVLNEGGELASSGAALEQHHDGSFTVTTLGIRPLEDVVEGFRNGSCQKSFASGTFNSSTTLNASAGMHFEMSARIRNINGTAGFTIAASPGGEEYTRITYNPENYNLVVDRSRSSLIQDFVNTSVLGYFYPYTYEHGTEPLDIRVFLDGSMLEVYINERFALTTRIYPTRRDSTGLGVFVGDGASVELENIALWTDLMSAWPERPANTSAQLVFDTPEQTNNYTWWPGF